MIHIYIYISLSLSLPICPLDRDLKPSSTAVGRATRALTSIQGMVRALVNMGFRVSRLGFWGLGLGFRVSGLGFWVLDSGFRV